MTHDLMKSSMVQMPAGFSLRALPVVGSTNDIARELTLAPSQAASGPTVIWGGKQTGGKGRSGRQWVSPEGNLYASILLQDVGDFSTAAQLSFVTAISMRAALARYIPKKSVECKWPNDILVNGAKICGILLECGTDKLGKNWVIVGSGVNVDHHPDDTPYAACHVNEFSEKIETHMVLSSYLEEFSQRFHIWKSNGFVEIRDEWLKNCFGFGKNIIARLANNVEEHGRFIDLDVDGALILEREDHTRVTITAGDVFVKGPSDVAGY